jgi:hypothetical protein
VRYVALADPGLENGDASIWERLAARGYRRDLAGQVTGWVFADAEEAPRRKPAYRPNCALLPLEGGRALVLVEINYVWVVLSLAGAGTYPHGEALLDGRELPFRPLEGRALRLRMAEEMAPESVGEALAKAGLPPNEPTGMTGQARYRRDSPALVVSTSSRR